MSRGDCATTTIAQSLKLQKGRGPVSAVDARAMSDLYRRTLLEDVVPFWMTHAVGEESGAIYNCLDDAGNVLSKDRYLWALWTFSALYNRVEPAGEWTQWLDRQGNKSDSVALPVKDPFHLPRGLIYLVDLSEKNSAERTVV